MSAKRLSIGWGFGERVLVALSRAPDAADRPAATDHWDAHNALDLLRQEFPDFSARMRGKAVLDFGCGDGWQSVALAEAGAAHVVGVDTNEACLDRARARLARLRLPPDRVRFVRRLPETGGECFDVAISQNSFEHFPDPASVLRRLAAVLRTGGELLITFGPPWFAPYGSHMHFFTPLPWVNVLFSEATVMRVRGRFRADGALHYAEVEGGLNQMTVARFERLLRDSGLHLEWKRYKCVKGAQLLQTLPGLREFFINHVSCVVRKQVPAPALGAW